MTTDPSRPLEDIDPASVAPGAVDEAEVRAALDASDPIVRRRGVETCETLAEDGIDAVEPFLGEVAPLAADDNVTVALGAIGVLDTVAADQPAALEGRLSALVDTLDTDLADVQLMGATALGKLVVARPDLLAPHARALIEAVRATEHDPEVRDLDDTTDDPVTRKTIQEHERNERRRRVSGRRTLINVVVAIADAEPRSMVDATDDLAALLDDADPGVAGGAIDALDELARADPGVVAPLTDGLIDCLGSDRTVIRARAIRVLGHLGDDAAVPELRALAESDDDEDVREVAETTAEFLADT